MKRICLAWRGYGIGMGHGMIGFMTSGRSMTRYLTGNVAQGFFLGLLGRAVSSPCLLPATNHMHAMILWRSGVYLRYLGRAVDG
jgi:hypothetical protein